MIISML